MASSRTLNFVRGTHGLFTKLKRASGVDTAQQKYAYGTDERFAAD